LKVKEIFRQNGISNATFYNWKANNVKRLKELEDENSRLKKLFAEVSLENHAMKVLFAKKAGNNREKILRQFADCCRSVSDQGSRHD